MQKFINYENFSKQNGFSLVELLISILLALFLAIVAGQSYLSTKTTYRATEQNARIQENLRFATHFINREVRQGGNVGCFQTLTSHLDGDTNSVSGLYNARQPINVWRYENNDDFDLSSGNAYTPGSAGQWVDGANRTLPALPILDGLVTQGSDIISVTKLSEPLGIRLADTNVLTSNTLSVTRLNNNNIRTGQVMLVGDCNASDLFVHTGGNLNGTDGATIERGNSGLSVSNINGGGNNWRKNWGSDAEVRFIESTLFFIGQGASNLPALFRLDLGNSNAQPLEIVDGIELMRGLIGVDSQSLNFSADGRDDVIDQYVRIDEINPSGTVSDPYSRILSLQIGLLAVGTENTNIEDANNRTFQITQRHQVTSPDTIPDEFNPGQAGSNDTRYRQSSTTTIELRNAGLARKAEIFFPL